MAYNGDLNLFEPHANGQLASRPPPEPWEYVQLTIPKQYKCEKINSPSIKKTYSAILTLPIISEYSADFRPSTYENLWSIMDSTLPFINAFPINDRFFHFFRIHLLLSSRTM